MLGEKLYNLREDMGEANNLIHAYPEKVDALKRQMKAFDQKIK